MCLNTIPVNTMNFNTKTRQMCHLRKQAGVSLAMLLFVIIIVSLLAAAIIRLTTESSVSTAQQVVSTRAFFAAESGAQLQAMALFPISGGAGACANQTYNFTVAGVNACSATTTCNTITVNGEDYFQVTSAGQCNIGQPLQATRTIEVRLKDIN